MAADPGLMTWKCYECNMTFGNPNLLKKHKSRFCVGSQFGDPDILLLRKGFRDESTPQHREIIDDKLRELRDYKDRRRRHRDISNFRKHIYLDEVTDRHEPYKYFGSGYGRLLLSKDKDIRQLQIEYERSKEGGRPFFPRKQHQHHVHKTPIDVPNYNPSTDPKVQMLAECHGRQMEYLQNKNKDLERQKEEIRQRLSELGRHPQGKDNSTEELLKELREQEERNQRLLDELKRQLAGARRPINVLHSDMDKKQYIYPVYYGNSLVSEIEAVRQAYLQNGGNDPDILSQLSQMRIDAQAIDDSMKNAQGQKQKDKKDTNISFLEMENERLQRQLLLLQEQKLISSNRRKDNREDELEHEIQRLQRDHLQKMHDLQREIERMRQETTIDRMRLEMKLQQAPTKIVLQQPVQQPTMVPPQPQRAYIDLDAAVPYDQYAGFVIFYDFVLNLDPNITAVRLLVGLHNLSSKLGDPSVLPLVYTEPSMQHNYMQSICNAVIGARQPVPRCPAQTDLGLVVEFQVAGAPGSNHDPTRLITRAWTKIPLFDGLGRLLAGRFRLALRCSPIKPYISFTDLESMAQFGDADLFYRIVNYRDASIQSLATIAATNRDLYQPAPVGRSLTQFVSHQHIPPPPSTTSSDIHQEFRSVKQSQILTLPKISELNSTEPTIGFQVDRVKHSELGEGKVRLTAYYVSSGKVVQSSTSAVTCSTSTVKSNFKYKCHVFGQQEATFSGVQLQGDMVLIARFYLKHKADDVTNEIFTDHLDQPFTVYDEETLVAWTAVPLVLCTDDNVSVRLRTIFDPASMWINTGTKTLKLFAPPVLESTHTMMQDVNNNREWKRYRNATIRLYIFQGQPRSGSLTPSDLSNDSDDDDVLPEFAWLPLERHHAPVEPYLSGDGFDIYLDGCLFLPDSVTFSKVSGRILDRQCKFIGKDFSSSVKLDSDIYNPVYEHKEEIREAFFQPSATFLFKVYTIDSYYQQLTVVGYATLNVFVETGTERQPNVDHTGLQVSLNEGCHQLRLFNQGPNNVDPFTEHCLRDAHIRTIPCASLLVRLYKVPRGPKGKTLQSDKIQKEHWARLGLWNPRPKYSDRVYLSEKCTPTQGEIRLFHSLLHRRPVTVRESVALSAKSKDGFIRSDKIMVQYIKNQLTESLDSQPLMQDLSLICRYSPHHGIKFSLDNGSNLSWTNFTHASICLNPPGAFYMGTPHATYDKLVFTEKLDPHSTHSHLVWLDDYKHFSQRSFHRFLCVIVHLQEIFVTSTKENYKYGLLEEAWTAVQVFKDRFAITSVFQLPLFSGGPNQRMLKQLAREPCKDWLERNIRSGLLKLVDGASVVVRLCDGRRDDELPFQTKRSVEGVNTEYIPRALEANYSREKPGRPLLSIIPHGKMPEQFMDNLAIKFKSLVYKLYEEGNVGND